MDLKPYVTQSHPVIIRRYLNACVTVPHWSLESLKKTLGTREVSSCYSFDGRFGADPDRLTSKQQDRIITLPFTRLIDKVIDSNLDQGFYYLQQGSLLTDFEELRANWRLPDCIEHDKVKAVNLWIGPKDGVSVLHYDRSNNFLMQLEGVKKVVLYRPSDCFRLYPVKWTSDAHHISRINDIYCPDLEKFPRFRLAKSFEISLFPGEILYIPPYWWHQIHSIDTSLSINIWWHANGLFQKLVPAYPRYLLREVWRKLHFK